MAGFLRKLPVKLAVCIAFLPSLPKLFGEPYGFVFSLFRGNFTMKFFTKSTRLAVMVLVGTLGAGAAMAQSSTFPQYEKSSCPSRFTTSGGKCTATEPGWVGMINPNGKGSCPSGFGRSTNYCTKKVGDDKPGKKDAGKSASAASENTAPDPEKALGGKPVVKRVAKKSELDYCPTGYHTSHATRGECVTPWADAPNVTVKKGSCPAGTTEEQGQFCTGATTLAPNLMNAAHIADFNALYMARNGKGMDTSDANKPAVWALAEKAAKPAAAAPASASTAEAPSPAAATEPASTSAIDPAAAAAAIGGVVKSLGLFSR